MIAVLILSLCSCRGENGKTDEYEAVLYFANAQKTQLVSEKRKISVNKDDEIINKVVGELLKGPQSQGFKRIIPEKTKLLSVIKEDDNAKLEFSKEFYNSDKNESILVISSVVRTVTEIDGINSVEFWVENEPMKDSDGKVMGKIRKQDIVYDTEPDVETKKFITLYFADKNSEYLNHEVRKISISPKETLEMRIMKELIKGPESDKMVKTVPPETKIMSVETKEGVCFVNLSQDFVTKHPGGTAGETMTVYSIVNSLTELDYIDKVQFLIEGQKMEVFINMIFNEPFERDESLIK